MLLQTNRNQAVPATTPLAGKSGVADTIPFRCKPDQGFLQWLVDSGGSLAISTYQAGMLVLLGWNGQQMSVLLRRYEKVMGLDVADNRLLLATRYGLSIFANAAALAPHYREKNHYDGLYLPRVSWHLPDLGVHDVALAGSETWMVVTRMSCLANPSDEHTFQPRWQPKFISDLVPEDRCHLNGLALRDKRPAYVTALAETNTAQGWRERKTDGGLVMDVAANEVICRGLAMPHSPRWYRNQLFVLHSGAGELLRVDTQTGQSDVVCRLQGYLRGLTFVGDHALIGLCQIRETNVFGGMPVQEEYDRLLSGIAVVNIKTGACEGMLEITSGCTELYDLRFLPKLRQPNILNLEKPDIRQAISAPGAHYWLHEESKESEL